MTRARWVKQFNIWRSTTPNVPDYGSDGLPLGEDGGGGGTVPPPTDLDTYLGVSELPQASWGTFNFPDVLIRDTSGGNWVNASGNIDDLNTAGAKCIAQVTPGNAFYRNPSVGLTRINAGGHAVPYDPDYPVGAFLPYVWEFYWDEFVSEVAAVGGGTAKWRAAFASGTIRWIQVLDDVGSTASWQTNNNFSRLVSFAEFERIAAHAHDDMAYAPIGIRTSLSILKGRAGTRQYQSLDLGVATFVPERATIWDGTQASADDWIEGEIATGVSCGLATAGAINIAQGRGDASLTDGWPRVAVTGTSLGLSPIEIIHGGNAMLNATRGGNSAVGGINIWSYNFGGAAYMTNTTRKDNSGRTIPSAMAQVVSQAVGRDDGPLSLHNLEAP